MSEVLLKSRWKTWETTCIEKAYKEKIQHKVVSTALGRSVTSVSKQIKKMGLRLPEAGRGRVKGEKFLVKETKRTLIDIEKMTGILKTYAPLNVFLTAEQNLKIGCWLSPPPSAAKKLTMGKCVGRIEKEKVSFSMFMPLDYIVSKDQAPLGSRRLKTLKEPLCVPLYHMEMWALREGFQQTKGVLQEQGLSYWKDGQYFSQAQLLMHINQIRHGKNLQTLILPVDERDSKS